jgi:hypothetical protein
MEEVCEHEPGGANLSENHLNRVCWTLPRLRQRRVAEPFGKRLAAPLGRRFDLLQLLGREPGRYSLGAEDRPCPCSSERLSIEIVARAGGAHGSPPLG